MGTKQAFKTYERGQRIQDTNVSFANGMSYTDAPLLEGFSRLLVNFDFGGEGKTLKPRRGLNTIEDGFYNSSLAYQDGMAIVAANQITHNGVEYYQIIVGGETNFSDSYSTQIGDAWVLTVSKQNGVNTVRYTPLNDTLLSQKCIFRKPFNTRAQIHGVYLTESEYIKKHTGVFAFNGDYYYFTTDGSLHHTYFSSTDKAYLVETVTPYIPLQAETQNSLYNILLDEPYSFSCGQSAGVLRLTGFAPYKDGELILNPQVGQEYDYKLYYTYPDEDKIYYFHIEYSTGDDTWYPIGRDESVEYKPGAEPFEFKNIRVDKPFAQFRIYAVLKDDLPKTTVTDGTDGTGVVEKDYEFSEGKQLDTIALSRAVVLVASFNYLGANNISSMTNLGLARYDLSYAKGMVYWKNRIWVYGTRTDDTILFASEVNRPDWFSYPANADIFDEEIVHLQPMLDELLVFTTHNLYSLALNADGYGWTKRHLQANLHIEPWDLNLIQIVKNMVFFKSGNYYYMVVPKLTAASGAGLAIAPVSKNITGLLDDFENVVKQVVDDLFNYSCSTRFGDKSKITYDLKLVHYYNHVDYEDVHNSYVFEVTQKEKIEYNSTNSSFIEQTKTVYLTFSLLYNTVSRTWRIYTLESERALYPLVANATSKGLYSTLINCGGSTALQILAYDDKVTTDSYIKQETSEPTGVLIFNNWQYYDSGYLDQNSDMKKRFREYQFKIINGAQSYVEFYSGFYLDRAIRTYEMYYEESVIKDEVNLEETVVIDATPMHGLQGEPVSHNESVIIDSETLYKYTKLGSWKLGTSKFPGTNNWKVRIPTSGKGYLPRIILISYNQTKYELLSCATIYRQLYSR